jgi:hypothetical protein
MLYLLAALVVLGALAPWIGADSRDGLDWAPNHFWLRRRPTDDDSRNADSRERAGGGRVSSDRRRTAPAAG